MGLERIDFDAIAKHAWDDHIKNEDLQRKIELSDPRLALVSANNHILDNFLDVASRWVYDEKAYLISYKHLEKRHKELEKVEAAQRALDRMEVAFRKNKDRYSIPFRISGFELLAFGELEVQPARGSVREVEKYTSAKRLLSSMEEQYRDPQKEKAMPEQRFGLVRNAMNQARQRLWRQK